MDADALAEYIVRSEALWERQLALTRSLLEHAELLTGCVRTLEAQLAALGDELTTLHAQTILRDNALGEQLETLDARVTNVHRAAIRALTDRAKGAPAA